MYIDAEERPKVQSTANYVAAGILHLLLFALFYYIGVFEYSKPELIIPVDLSIVVKENIDGNEGEPPPLEDPPPPEPEPEPEPPKPEPLPEPDREPPAVQQVEPPKTNKVEVVKKEEPPKPPEPPKKTAAELRAERMAKMREQAKDVKDRPKPPTRPVTNGKTTKQPLSEAEIKKLWEAGCRPAAYNGDLNASDEARCQALIRQAIEDRWNQMLPQIGREGTVRIDIVLGTGGSVVSCKLTGSCGDRVSDNAALSVVKAVRSVRGLSTDFIRKHMSSPLTISYQVKSSR